MSSILRPGYVRWDGLKYVLDPDIEIVGPSGLPGPAGANGTIGSDGDATLIYRPGGTASGNVFTSWTLLMAKRATIQSPMTVVIDDSIISPAPIDVGVWNLTHNTRLIGVVGNRLEFSGLPMTQLSIPDGAQLLDPNMFVDLDITGVSTSLPSIETPGLNLLNFEAWNCIFRNNGTSGVPLIHTSGGTIDLYGECHLISSNNSSFIISGNAADGYLALNINDQCVVDGYSLQLSGSILAFINISGGGSFGVVQPGISIFPTVMQQNAVQGAPSNVSTSFNPNVTVMRPTGYAPAIGFPLNGIVSLGSNVPGFSYQNGSPTQPGVNANYSSVLGGNNNDIGTGSINCVILGGSGNLFNNTGGSPTFGYIAGRDNKIQGTGLYNAIIGGEDNNIDTCTTCFILGRNSSIANGCSNSVIVGGDSQGISGSSSRAIVAGGVQNFVIGGQGCGVFAGQNNTAGGGSGLAAVVLGGDLNHATNFSCAVVAGEQNQSTAQWSAIIAGNQNVVSGQGSVIVGGGNNTLSGTTSVILGGSSNAISTASGAVVLGGTNCSALSNNSATIAGTAAVAQNTHAVAMGNGASAIHASQFAQGFGSLSGVTAQFSRYSVFGQTSGATPLILVDENGSELGLLAGRAFAVRATCIANRVGVAGRAMFIHTLLVHQSSGTTVIDNDNVTLSVPNGQTWTIVFSANGNALRATFTGTAGQNVNTMVTYEWFEVGGGA
jgi:hypothetical protein